MEIAGKTQSLFFSSDYRHLSVHAGTYSGTYAGMCSVLTRYRDVLGDEIGSGDHGDAAVFL